MKAKGYLLAGAAVVLAVAFLLVCSEGKSEETVIDFKIKGMTCNHCVENVTKALQSVEGVDTAIVYFEEDSAVVRYKDQKPSEEALVKAVEKAGYGAEVMSEAGAPAEND
ncbi:MAG: hypothetical protein GWO41_03390 [candidate division Zixibacteria bacterium]|nr:hypothetical protein [candidate division Zixibacteria bacterium]NIR63977.1 hypothetical protein [candidate division Zixibacteria bacterium]NIS15267.1 hypothetical protein [candidate division Zixibacteria bacterium]NIS45898.1 hypothetical protein [candidate division Zixibacteria bacterium]NIT51801.1 hypothetical protein [candidate division Zixibacteria bacterium]